MKQQWLGLRAIPLLVAIALPLRVSALSHSTLPKLEPSNDIDTTSAADRLMQQGNQAYQAGQLEAAAKFWQQAHTDYQQHQNHAGAAIALANLGAAYVTLERYREAIAALEAFLPLAHSLGNRQGEAQALGNLGIAYKELGSYDQALRSHRQAGKLMRELGDRAGLGQVLVNLGNVFEAIGDYDNALIAYRQSLTIARQQGDRVGEGVAQGNLGGVYANLGQYDQAIAAQTSSLAIAKATGNREGQASALINLGTYHERTNPRQAIDYYNESLAIAQQINHRQRAAEALGSLGLAYEDLKEYPKAIADYEQSLAIARQLNDPQLEGLTLNNLGHALFGAGKLAAAEQRLREAIQLLDALRPGLNDTYKASIFETQVYTYNLLQQILIAAKQPEAALELAEHGRARAFVELLARRLVGGRGVGEVGKQREAGEAEREGKQGREGEAGKEGKQGQQLATYTSQIAVQPISIAAIKQVARQQNATLVEYAIVPDDDFKAQGKQRAKESELLIWVVQPSGKVDFRQVDLKPLWQNGGRLESLVRLARCLIPGDDCKTLAQSQRGLGVVSAADPKPGPVGNTSDRTTPRLKQPGLQKLHQLLIAPIADLLPHSASDRVIFIPQEALFLAPFAALQDENGNYLIENYTVSTAPAIQVLALTRQQARQGDRKPSLHNTLIVGNPTMPSVSFKPGQPAEPLAPLPGAEKEAIAIAQLLGTTAITGKQATKANLLSKLSTAKLVHLATHGLLEYSSQSTLLEGLGIPGAIALAPSGNDNGLLTTSEVLDLHLNADLVTLSACDTGQGRITGDGVVGLSRAFIAAGVPSVIVSLWAVPDAATAKLMTTFYQTLQQQPDKAQALRQAMLTTMKDYPNPIDWAAFTLIGEAE